MENAEIRRRLAWLLLGLFAVAIFIIGIERSATRTNDFDNFYDAAVSVWQQGEVLLEKGTARYPPSFQVMISPLGALPIVPAAVLWTLVSVASYAALVWLFAVLGGVAPRRQWLPWFCVLPFAVSNVTLGQSGPVLLALATAGILASAHGRARLGGAALAAAGLLKVFPAALLAVPVALGRSRDAILGAALLSAGVSFWVVLALGVGPAVDDSLRWLHEVRLEQTPQHLVEVVRSLRYNNQGLAITMVRSLSIDFSWAPQLAARGSLQLLEIPVRWVWALYYLVVAGMGAVLAGTAWRLRGVEATPRTFLGLYAATVPLMLALSPIVWTHYFLWLLPGFVYLEERRRFLLVVGVLSLLAVFSVPARALGFHMWLALVLFGLVTRDLLRSAAAARP